MMRREFIGTAGAAGFELLSGCRTGRSGLRRPNVVFVLTDQWRADATGYAGDPNVKTPHLDALAAESFNFKNAVACCPVCSPARASLITGQYPLKHGVFLNDVCLNHAAPSIADCFNAAGYRTGWIGKWHLDGHGRSAFIPPERRQGFQYWKALECSHDYSRWTYYDNNDPQIRKQEGYDVLHQTEDAKDFIRQNSGQPFLLFLSWGPPHDPYLTAPGEFRQMYDPSALTLRPNVPRDEAQLIPRRQWDEKADALLDTPAFLAAGYYAHCTAMDKCIGDLRETIRAAGLEQDTIFVFTSDHGDMLGSHGQWNKQQPYDESVRIPLLFRVPMSGKTAETVETPVNITDLMPTLCELCGIPVPDSVEGRSYVPELHGGGKGDEAALIAHYHAFGQWSIRNGGREWRGIRTARYTYVRDLNGPWLLFDNETDPYQMNNQVNRPETAELQAKLDSMLNEKLRQTGDRFEPGMEYVRRWNYPVDENGTVKYSL